MAAPKRSPQVPRVAQRAATGDLGRPAGLRRASRAEALDIIFATAEEEGEGFRHGALGIPRRGKTYHLKRVIDEARDRNICEWVFIHDNKRPEVQYDGNVRASVADLASRPLTAEEEMVVVFHADVANGHRADVEECAAFALRHGRAGNPTLFEVDELAHGLKSPRTWTVPNASFSEIIREGSSQRVSSAWTTQFPQWLPPECLDFSETIAIFQLNGRSLSYIVDMLRLPPEAEATIKTLKRGEFILYTMHGEWDRTIYGPN